MAKKKPAPGNPIPEWVLTYGDLMSLLLCFFILLAAFSELRDPDQFQEVIDAIKEALGTAGDVGNADRFEGSAEEIIEALTKKEKGKNTGQDPSVTTESNTTGLQPTTNYVHEGAYHTVGSSLLYDGGATNLTPAMERVLREEIAPKIKDQKYITRIAGHAYGHEDATVGTYEEVAFRRAMAAREFLVNECGVDGRILRIEVAGNVEPNTEPGNPSDGAARHRRVQVYTTDRLVDQMTSDPYGSGRGGP